MREFLMLGKVYEPSKHHINNWYLSEKLDGMRAIWIPGYGLLSRYMRKIWAPDWWTNKLPHFPVDGELWSSRGQFQQIMSVTRTQDPDKVNWAPIGFYIFDSPTYSQINEPGRINNPTLQATIHNDTFRRGTELNCNTLNWEWRLGALKSERIENDVIRILGQKPLSHNTSIAKEQIETELDRVIKLGGEGLMLRNPSSIWQPKRSNFLLKVKQCLDAEGVVVGFNDGKGKHDGRLGSVTVELANGIRFDLSGFTDAERENPPKMGEIISFKYRELTNDGKPKEARYWRKQIT